LQRERGDHRSKRRTIAELYAFAQTKLPAFAGRIVFPGNGQRGLQRSVFIEPYEAIEDE
jgi:hypothetical protein